jgi:hypothetical protein
MATISRSLNKNATLHWSHVYRHRYRHGLIPACTRRGPSLCSSYSALRSRVIPQTLRRLVAEKGSATNLGVLAPGDCVNREVDLIARYDARLMDVGDKTA